MVDQPIQSRPGTLHIGVVAGEASGDLLGARLMAGLRQLWPGEVRFSGVGGPAMTAQGLTSLFPMAELSVMGIVEILPRAPQLLRRVGEVVKAMQVDPPDVLVTVDSPAFSFRVARRLKRARCGFPLVHYVAPTVWAWRPGRARMIAGFLDHLLVVLPFEPPWFRIVGLEATFVGHSVVEGAVPRAVLDAQAEALRQRLGIAPGLRAVCLLPGSRQGEVGRLLPLFRDTAALLAKRIGPFVAILPTLAHLEDTVRASVADWPVPVHVLVDPGDKLPAMAACDVALAASGTVTLELALARTPMLVTYRVSPVTAAVLRLMVSVRHASLVNLIEDAPIIPERLQGAARPDVLAGDLVALLDDPNARERQFAAIDRVMAKLGLGGEAPGLRAARAVLGVLHARTDRVAQPDLVGPDGGQRR